MSYDQWKCDSGYDECDPEWPCVCGDTGFLPAEFDDGDGGTFVTVIPCTECSREVTLDDHDEIDYQGGLAGVAPGTPGVPCGAASAYALSLPA